MGAYTGSGPTDPVVGNKTSVTSFGVPTADAVQALASATSSYTPTIAGSGWAVGNGTVSGGYTQIGKFVVFRATFTLGTTSTAGAGAMTISLPVNSIGGIHAVSHSTLDNNVPARYNGVGVLATSTVTPYYTPSAAGGADRTATTSVPMTWATSDSITVSGWYEAA